MFIHRSYIHPFVFLFRIPSRKTCFCYRPMCIPHHLLDNSLSSPTFYPTFIRTSLRAVSLFLKFLYESHTFEVEVPKSNPNFHQKRYGVTPEIVWGTGHGIVGLGVALWWQGTVHLAQMARASQR